MGKSIAAAIMMALLAITVAAHLMTRADPATSLAREVLEAQFSGSFSEVWDSLAPNVQQMYVDTASAYESAGILRRDFGQIEKLDYQGREKADYGMRRLFGQDLMKHTWLVQTDKKSFQYSLFWGDDGKIKAFRMCGRH